MQALRSFVRFLAGLFRKPPPVPPPIDDSPEMVLEKELRRGMRGD